MTAAKPHHQAKGKELLAALGVAGVAASAGALVAHRLRTGARETPSAPRTSESAFTPTPLVGHEFSFMGHTFHVIESARDSEDGSIRFDYSAPPRANIPEHTHHFQEESFEVVSGKLGVRVGGRELILGPGQSAIGPPKVPHAWWNPSGEERVRFVPAVRPGLDLETLFETLLGLKREGKTMGPIPKNPLQATVLVQEIASWVVLRPVERVLLAPVRALAFVGGMFGYRARYPEYSASEARDLDEAAAVSKRATPPPRRQQ